MNKYGTIDIFEDLTEQQVFDISARLLLRQRTQSKDRNGACAYRSAEGMCAAGPFLRDDFCNTTDTSDTAWRKLVNEGFAPETHCSLVSALQAIHDDSSSNMSDWVAALRGLAETKGLDTVVVDYYADPYKQAADVLYRSDAE